MSGEELCCLLNTLGYKPKGRSLSRDSLEWMFTSESTRPFLVWLCRSVSMENLLTESEIERFSKLEGSTVAEEEGFEDGSFVELENEQRDEISMCKDRISSLEKELARTELESAKLARRCEFLECYLSSERMNICSLNQHFEREKERMKEVILPQVCRAINRLREDFGELSRGLSQLETSYSSLFGREQGDGCAGNKSSCFVSGLDWSDYYKQEDRCCENILREIGADDWWRELCNDSDGEGEKRWREIELYELIGPKNGVVEGSTDCDLLYEDRLRAELSRLQSAYATNEKLKLDGDISLARVLAVLNTVKHQNSNRQRYRIMNTLTLKSKIDQVSEQLDQVSLTARVHLDTLSSRIHTEMPQLLSLPVLRACEGYKIAFQERLFAQMNRVEQHIIEQEARYRLLSLVLDKEKSVHTETYSMVMALRQEMQDFKNSIIDRLGFMQARIEYQQEYLKPPSAASLSLLSQLILEKTVNVNNTKELIYAAREIKKRIEVTESSFIERNSIVDSLIQRSLSSISHDSLISPLVESKFRELREAVSVFGSQVESVLKEYTLVKKTISELPKKRRLERNLWIYFFGDYKFLQKVQEMHCKNRSVTS